HIWTKIYLKYIRVCFFAGYHPFKLGMLFHLEAEEKLWMMETETQRSEYSGEKCLKTETLQTYVALKYHFREELLCWHIWEQVASELTKHEDSTINLQGKSSQLLQGDSIHVAENENYVMKHRGDSSSCTENQEFPSSRTQDSWKKTYLSESQNQNRSKEFNMKKHEDFMKKSPFKEYIKTGAELQPYKCGQLFSDDCSQQLPLGRRPHMCSQCGKGFSYSLVLPIRPSVHRKE
uniref:C2H2-type domain-containing protein n=1 Tax=Loxodonta africana TaxID=9785 RepID=G3SMP6_LOXAF